MTNRTKRAYEHCVLEEAAELLEQHYMRGETFTHTQNTADYLRAS